MSAYIVNDETISIIAKGFVDYGVGFISDDYEPKVYVIVNYAKQCSEIGQSLLNQNYASVNYRYRKYEEPRKFEYKNLEYNEGMLVGCIDCYIYQTCETADFFESELYYSLKNLKNEILDRLIKQKGQKISWGYEKMKNKNKN